MLELEWSKPASRASVRGPSGGGAPENHDIRCGQRALCQKDFLIPFPVWLDTVLAQAAAADRERRFGDAMELAFELEHGLAHGGAVIQRKQSLYHRNPLRFWQVVSLILLLALIATLTQ